MNAAIPAAAMVWRNAASDTTPAVLLLTELAVLQQQREGAHWRDDGMQTLLDTDCLSIRGSGKLHVWWDAALCGY
jgi:hypothetical protein